jgi:hypothetical protein
LVIVQDISDYFITDSLGAGTVVEEPHGDDAAADLLQVPFDGVGAAMFLMPRWRTGSELSAYIANHNSPANHGSAPVPVIPPPDAPLIATSTNKTGKINHKSF